MRAPQTWQDLVHTVDDEPGIRRRGRSRPRYVHEATGEPVRDPSTLERLRALAIPPAWSDVWICAEPTGHLQATGRDARGRKQYRYHALFRARREHVKFADLIPFGEVLGPMRHRVEADLRTAGLSEDRVLALVIALLDETGMRVGNEDYAQSNGTFGLTTLRDRHVRVDSGGLRFCFVGKGGRTHAVCVDDRRLARLVRQCRDLPGQQLFQWQDDDGELHPVGSTRVNDRIRELTGLDATAKTFRTWGASVRAAELLAVAGEPDSKRDARAMVLDAVDEVATELGNTRAVCRASYVHPAIPASYEAARLQEWWADGPSRAAAGLRPEERKLLAVLRRARKAGLGTPSGSRRRKPGAAAARAATSSTNGLGLSPSG